jgi:predicted membrane-bound mannosyltransferase
MDTDVGGGQRQRDVTWPRAIALYAILTAIVFSAIPYKTPWNLVPFHAALVAMAGCGAAGLLALARRRLVRVALALVLAAGTCQLGLQAWRANTRYAADPRNPYVYAQTTPDFLGLVARVDGLAATHPDGRRMFVKVVAAPYEQWPLPWYLRKMTRVGYWTTPGGADSAGAAPVVVASQENSPAVEAALGDGYVSEFYGLRPDVVLTLYVERDLWQRYIRARTGDGERD